MDDLLTFVREQLLATLKNEQVRQETIDFLKSISGLPEWVEERLAALLYGAVTVGVEQIADGEPPSEDAEQVRQWIQDQLVKILDDDDVKQRVIDMAAEVLPLPNFIERRILGIIYSALFRAIQSNL